MNKKILPIFLLPLFSLASCNFLTPKEEDKDSPKEISFLITGAEYTDDKGHMSVSYTCSELNPFMISGHTFSSLNNFGNPVRELNYSKTGVFTLKTAIIDTKLKFEFVDTDGVIYLTSRYDNVKQYEVPDTPDIPDTPDTPDIPDTPDTPDTPDVPDTPDTPTIDYPTGYKTLYWSDEFNGTSLDKSNWTYEIGNGYGGWGNGESQYYTDHNDYVKDGELHIVAKKEVVDNFNYTSTRIKTQNKVKFTYGYIEARISLPLVNGMWPAFWMMPNDSVYGGWPHSGEIDIMEAKGRLAYQSSSALHFSDNNGHTYKANEKSGHYIADYHKYAVEWQKEYVKYYIDDVLHFSVNYYEWSTKGALSNEYAPFDKDFYLILNLAVGGHFDNWILPPESFSSAEMKIDYVRVFK